MEKQNAETNAQGGNLSDLKKMFTDYQKKQSTTRKSREDILKKYFVPRNTKELFRILPPKAGKKHIEEAFFHVVTTNTAGGKKKHGTVIYCPAHNDPKVQKLGVDGKPELDSNGQPKMIPAPCPLCVKAKKILVQQDPSLKGIKKENLTDAQKRIFDKNKEIFMEANKWEAKKFYIVRGVDKGQEKDGVKFWRFKHNFRNQGTLDKLLPILEEYMTTQQADFSDPQVGTDLSIAMADTEFNGHVYKTISAISFRGKSLLHSDPIVVRQWLDDNSTWREVFLPKRAPGVEPYEFLEMVANGTNPYWEDTDANNKHWVFPGRPDLEEAANTRKRNNDADENENFEMASDMDEELPRVTISNMTESKIGTYTDNASDVSAEALAETSDVVETTESQVETGDTPDYDDLPF
jgi:hypothetical protein